LSGVGAIGVIDWTWVFGRCERAGSYGPSWRMFVSTCRLGGLVLGMAGRSGFVIWGEGHDFYSKERYDTFLGRARVHVPVPEAVEFVACDIKFKWVRCILT